jgi:hypothetical protein
MLTIARKHSLQVQAVDTPPKGTAVSAARIGLYRPWMPSIDEGWTRWLLEQYAYNPTTLYNADIKAGKLRERFDALIIPDMSYGSLMLGFAEKPDEDRLSTQGGVKPSAIRPEYDGGIGSDGAMALRDFVAQGGTLLAFNNAAPAVIDVLGLPVTNILEGVKSDQFFCSGALLQVELSDSSQPAVLGMPAAPIVMFEKGPAFEPKPGFEGTILARYPKNANPLKSGVLLYPERIQGKAAAVEVGYGRGRVFLYGFRPQWRGQSHGTYKLVLNALYRYDTAAPTVSPVSTH